MGDHRYADLIMARRPVAYWRLGDAGRGTARDWSGHGRTGAYRGSPTSVPPLVMGATEQAVRLNGTTQYVDAADDAVFSSSAVSVECWCQPDALPAVFGALVSKAGASAFEWGLSVLGAGAGRPNTVEFIIWNSAGTELWRASAPNNSLVAGRLYHVAGTFDGSANIAVYLNGARAALNSLTTGGTRTDTTSLLTIGVRGDLAGSYFTGVVDEVSVYDKVLGPGDVAASYAAGRGMAARAPRQRRR